MLDDIEVAPKPVEKTVSVSVGPKWLSLMHMIKTVYAKSKDVEQQTPFST